MARFLTGDELGNIKSLTYTSVDGHKTEVQTLYDGSGSGKNKSIQALAVASSVSERGRVVCNSQLWR